MDPRRFIEEVKQRHVFRAVGVYVVAAFALWQAADIAIPALSLPESWMRYIVAGALAGLPVVALLAWLFDLDWTAGKGAASRSSRVRRIAGIGAAVLVALLLAGGLIHRVRLAGNGGTALRATTPVSFALGVERYFAGDHAGAGAILEAVADDPATTGAERKEALRYLVRSYSESGDSTGARTAVRRLLGLEPPLVLMLPGVETPDVTRIYYEARREKLAARGAAGGPAPVRTVEVLDFSVLGQPPTGVPSGQWQTIGRSVKEMLLSDLASRALPGVGFVDHTTAEEQRGFDVYRYYDSPESTGLTKATHLLIGSVAARGDQVLISAWLINVSDGALRLSAQKLARMAGLFDLISQLVDELASEVRSAA